MRKVELFSLPKVWISDEVHTLILPKKILIITITEDKDEGGCVVSCDAMPGCLTCGETIQEALENFDDTQECGLEAAEEDCIEKA